MNKNVFAFGFVVLLLTAMPAVVFAGNADQEIATATTHARMAGNAADPATAIMHFHHVINCLVGPKSKLFDADVGNPCKGMGNGALNDVEQKSTAHAQLLHALALARQALHADKLATTQKYALRIGNELKKVKPNG
jgi:hypothetical protein